MNNQFYLGRIYDPTQKKTLDTQLLYDPADLTTHAIITGMTGSGKTGLVVDILEEAALQKIPAIIIDPKGDLTNLLLHFPNQSPQDYEPWLDVEVARREGKDLNVLAEETANTWKKGQSDWGIDSTQINALKNSVAYNIFTPGSTAGQPINILSSFSAPPVPWEANKESLREEIASTVSALLGLIGLKELDPLRSREHILLSNLLENAWSKGLSFDLTELILQTQKPPFERLGAFPLENFFPSKDRMELAMLLNNFLASPSFQSWLEGQPLDIPSLIATPENKPRHSIFYIAHLDNNERMFFVSLLLASVEAWMRSQRGTSGLRLLIAFDEIMGYMPATSNPPSRTIMLRMLKQARAFGVGLMLATQNPIDVDYKALSNTGSWFIGRLQTEQDKERLMDGLRSAGGDSNLAETNRLISSLGKRVFYLHNVHESKPQVFSTRWTMNFLAGPLTRTQIPEVLKLVQTESYAQPAGVATAATVAATTTVVTTTTASRKTAASPTTGNEYSVTRPSAPGAVTEYFLQTNLEVASALKSRGITTPEGTEPESIIYQAALLAQARIYYYSRPYNIEHVRLNTILMEEAPSGLIKWEEYVWKSFQKSSVKSSPLPKSLYTPLPGWLMDEKKYSAYQKDFLDWVFRNGALELKSNELLKVFATPDMSEAEFQKRCAAAAAKNIAEEKKKLDTDYQKKINSLKNKIKLQESEVKEQKGQIDQRRLEELSTGGELILSMFTGRKKSLSSSLSKRRMTAKAKSQYEQEMQELDILEKEYEILEKEHNNALAELDERWKDVANKVTTIQISPYKKDIQMELFGIAWMPYYLLRIEGRQVIVPAVSTRDTSA